MGAIAAIGRSVHARKENALADNPAPAPLLREWGQ